MRNSELTYIVVVFLISGIVGTVVSAADFVPPARFRSSVTVSVSHYGAISADGKDDTAAFQRAIDALPASGGTVNVPAGSYMINTEKSILLRNNMYLKMDPHAVLRAISNSLDNGSVLSGTLIHDVEISGGTIIGDRTTHLGTTGESGMGIRLNGALRVTIRDTKFVNHWGDGIYIGAYQKDPVQYSSDVVLFNVVSRKNRRQGLSITNASNIKVYNSEFSYTEGTAPQYGIDIEPNQIATPIETSRYAKDIEIVNCKIHHNKGGGIQFYKYVSNVFIKQNDLSYNQRGIYSIESSDTTISQNVIAHNRSMGITFQSGSDNFKVENNIFRNNSTNQFGISNDTNPLQSIKGLLEGTGGEGTTPHIGIQTGVGTINVMTNEYAK
jgi:parallel beta-helix repeat protein